MIEVDSSPPDLAGPLPSQPVTRFAPSPTGFLHLGHVAHAVYVWGLARRLEGTVVLRMEDHDRGRSRPYFERGILEDLEWLGLEPDRGSAAVFQAGPTEYRQSDRGDRYAECAGQLNDATYWCECSRRDIAATEAPPVGSELRYPGTCRDRGLAEGPDRGLRVRIPEGEVVFVDALQGPQRQTPSRQAGDLLLRDRHGNWTYQFAVTVDDWDQGITLVIRGLDLLSSTGRQIQLAARLGRAQPPTFLHHPLVQDDSRRKLSKRDASSGVQELRAAGTPPGVVLGRAAYAVGLTSSPASLTAEDLPHLFDRWAKPLASSHPAHRG